MNVIQCPGCGTQAMLPPGFPPGLPVQCPQCGTHFVTPGAGSQMTQPSFQQPSVPRKSVSERMDDAGALIGKILLWLVVLFFCAACLLGPLVGK